jgi:hypothetical protein
MHETIELEPVQRLTKDIKEGATTLGRDEARFLVDLYYMMQEDRKRGSNQVRSLVDGAEPHATLAFFAKQFDSLERQVKNALDAYSGANPLGLWARSIVGIGPVIAAGLLAHIDIEKAHTAANIWRFAGLDPTSKWEKGQKRPYNAALKTLCWKIGESFVKVSNHEDDIYGKFYQQRKAVENDANEAGHLREEAERALATKKIGKDTDAYKAYSVGKLPPAHIHARAKRWVVKLFLSHYHEMAYELLLGKKAPAPHAMTMLGHIHYIGPKR